ncbi:hypothetical protein [Ferrimonas balearica]|uniref:hypothetical protein n=1 Tax=Ferrimonas balearica TaxID=44012 RepID=UPI001C996632|nr:hypothetical protein [Ferrimonas balearica]MBY5990769.1 hypothetical protein [Ferrimonas balearica]
MVFELYRVKLGYSYNALVRIDSVLDFYRSIQYVPSSSLLGRISFALKLFYSIVRRNTEKRSFGSLVEPFLQAGFIALPWSQHPQEKVTFITFDNVSGKFLKYGKSCRAVASLKTEVSGVQEFTRVLSDQSGWTVITPEFTEGEKTSEVVLVYPLVKAKRSKELPPISFPIRDSLAFNESAYFKHTYPIIRKFCSANYLAINDFVELGVKAYGDEIVGICSMHGDLSNSNVLVSPSGSILIDFEDFTNEGINIEKEYFDFRYRFDREKTFEIETALDFFCVYHYLYFQSKHESEFTLEKIKISEDNISLNI